MKKLAILFMFIAFISCKTNEEQTYTGGFVYYQDAAVFQMGNVIHGVILNNKVDQIITQAKAFQQAPTDMVEIEVIGELVPKGDQEEGWPYKLKINKVISVTALAQNKNDVIKLGK
ncbi:hypothetical protein [Olleya namhaensis]|uniref:hypothetical protein n=1 Tax=Olleya namhaensis TaxID=1144750 RepID=UPI00248FC30B|nr:hypothetical protein [Olleya namhaensis]